MLEWVAIPFSKGSSQPGMKPMSLTSPALAGGFSTSTATCDVREMDLNQLLGTYFHPPPLPMLPIGRQNLNRERNTEKDMLPEKEQDKSGASVGPQVLVCT